MSNQFRNGSILYANTISKRKIQALNKQLEEIPVFWKERFLEDNWKIIITNQMPEEFGGRLTKYYADTSQSKIWLNVSTPSMVDNDMFIAIACYAYMEYGNLENSNTFNYICQKEQKPIKLFMAFRGVPNYDAFEVFIEFFSFVIETDGNYNAKSLSLVYNYIKKWVNGEIFNINYSDIPYYIEIGKNVLKDQIEQVEKALYALPTKLLEKFKKDKWKIYLSNEKLSDDLAHGFCSSDKKIIYVKSSSPDVYMIVWHEFGHYLDYQEYFASKRFFFKLAYNSEKAKLKQLYKYTEEYNYAISSTEEYFAEIFAHYLNDSATLGILAPRSMQQLEKIVRKWR